MEEPWHIRYVGVEHAMYMKEHNLCLEEYIKGIEDGTIIPAGGEAAAAEEPETPDDPDSVPEEAGEPDAA